MDATTYVYNLPEDYTLKQRHRAQLDRICACHNINNEAAQEMIDLHVAITEDTIQEFSKQWSITLIKAMIVCFAAGACITLAFLNVVC